MSVASDAGHAPIGEAAAGLFVTGLSLEVYHMKLAKSLLLGAAAGLATVAAASAADLPSRKSAPVEYVKVCNAYGAGFFYIPGTDTCLKVGGMVAFDARSFTLQRTGGGAGAAVAYRRANVARDLYGSGVLGRLELDARNQTAYGTLRTFLRVDAMYSTASSGVAGSLSHYNSGTNGWILPAASKDSVIASKAFIQFAGITAGRAQSMFDFYADAYNLELLRGSNATTNLLAYTATFGGGFSATLSFEDEVARRAYVASLRNAGLGPTPATVVAGTWLPYAEVGGTRIPDIVANLRVDQGWGSAQLSGALHRVSAVEGASGALAVTNSPAFPTTILSESKKTGWALQGGVKINLPMLAAGDAFFLQATYAKGAVGYTNGTNLVFFEGINNARHQGGGALNGLNSLPHATFLPMDCVFTANGKCELSKSWALTAALKHFWSPTVSSSLFAGYFVHEQASNVAAAALAAGPASFGGRNNNAPKFRELRVGTNLMWTPVRGFDIGAELMYMRGDWSKFVVPASNPNPSLVGRTKLDANQLETRVVVRRAF